MIEITIVIKEENGRVIARADHTKKKEATKLELSALRDYELHKAKGPLAAAAITLLAGAEGT